MLGVFDTENNLLYSRQEDQILDKYCRDNNLFKYLALIGDVATYENVQESLNDNCHIFYYSGHCHDGALYFSWESVRIEDVLTSLVDHNCSIIILNCCNSYEYIKKYYEEHRYLNSSLNVICTINDVSDEQAMMFMTLLFRYLELGYPISEAIRTTKQDLFIEYKGQGNTWWSYLLFGNPYTMIDYTI